MQPQGFEPPTQLKNEKLPFRATSACFFIYFVSSLLLICVLYICDFINPTLPLKNIIFKYGNSLIVCTS